VILYKKGFIKSTYKSAAEDLKKAIELGLKNGDLLSYLSMIYYELGDRENSIKYAKEALDTNPSSEEYKARYEGILKYAGKRNFFILKMRPSAIDTWPVTMAIKPNTLKTDLPNLNISIGENYEEDV
jgi:tetratricopeptide (TPR) repeat protein